MFHGTFMPIGSQMKSVLLIIGGCLVAGACASTGATPRPFPAPREPARAGTTAPRANSADADRADVDGRVELALALRGTPYRNGGVDRTGFDCSGFTQYVFRHNGVNLPRDVIHQYGEGRSVDRDKLAAGDLVFFTTTAPGASH